MHAEGAAVLISGFVLHLRGTDDVATTVACAPVAVARKYLLRSVGREPPSVEVLENPLPRVMGERHGLKLGEYIRYANRGCPLFRLVLSDAE